MLVGVKSLVWNFVAKPLGSLHDQATPTCLRGYSADETPFSNFYPLSLWNHFFLPWMVQDTFKKGWCWHVIIGAKDQVIHESVSLGISMSVVRRLKAESIGPKKMEVPSSWLRSYGIFGAGVFFKRSDCFFWVAIGIEVESCLMLTVLFVETCFFMFLL